MEKKYLDSFVDKYHLNGMVESVTWNATDTETICKFVTPTKDCAGSVTISKDLDLGDSNISIFSTSQLNRMLNIMDSFITVEVVKGNQGIPYQMKVKDKDFDLDFYLASEDLIPNVPSINEPEQYDVEFTIDEDFIKNFTKAHSALEKPNRFVIGCGIEDEEKYVELTVGDSATFANKIKTRQNAHFLMGIEELPFSANVLKEILSVNKNATGKAYINEAGLLKLIFTEGDITSTYFMVRLSE